MNNIYFKEDFSERLFEEVPQKLIDIYHIEPWEESTGFIRILDGKIIVIYVHFRTNIQTHAILKFNYKNNKINFDSMYLRSYNGSKFSNDKEYRLDKDNKLIATYNFKSKEDEFFVVQNKESEGSKKYKNFIEPQPVSEDVKSFSKNNLSKEITEELFDAFHPENNENEIYFIIE
tara:strand:+ start:8235 stop:8759 length:525 start_codon:yes stop_codon:yes gene_type:complete